MLAIVGAGDIAGALAQRAAARERFRDIRVIDEAAGPAAGKALDIRQAGPVDRYDSRVTGHASLDAAAGAHVVAVADRFGGGEWEGDAGLAMLAKLLPAIGEAPILFTGAKQRWLIDAAHRELKVPAARLAGSAPLALEAALRALAALAIDGAASDVQLHAYGRPPESIVIGWSAGVAAGTPIERALAPNQRLAIADRAKGLWPPGPIALGSAACRIAEAFASGSRRDLTCFAIDGKEGAVALPVRIAQGKILRVNRPALSPREQVDLHL
jgi:malate dehydrogenase